MPEVRRSFSEPSVISRRGALELSRESQEKAFVRRGFAMDEDPPGPSQRRSREAKRSGEENIQHIPISSSTHVVLNVCNQITRFDGGV